MITVHLTEDHLLTPTDKHLIKMRRAIAEIDDPSEALFFKAHLEGMERLAELQKKWLKATLGERPVLAEQITALRNKLMESLEVLKPEGAEAPSASVSL